MAVRKALLIGVPTCDVLGVPDLPIVANDIRILEEALVKSRYSVSTIGLDERRATRNVIRAGVREFLQQVQNADTAIVYFSGHGLHSYGADYLIPADGYFGAPTDLDDYLVRLDFSKDVSESQAHAKLILFVVDACREGVKLIDDSRKKNVTVGAWGTAEINLAQHRELCYVLSCSSGQFSGYSKGADGSSYFTRALSEVLDPAFPATTLKEVLSATQERLRALVTADGADLQEIRRRLETSVTNDLDNHVICDSGTKLPETAIRIDRWQQRVTSSPLWQSERLIDASRLEEWRDLAARIAAICHEFSIAAEMSLPDDPWRDPEFPLRALEKTEWLCTCCGLQETKLNPAEAALLSVAPFVREAMLSQGLLHVKDFRPLSLNPTGDASGSRRIVEKAHRQFPQLVRSAQGLYERGREPEHNAIAAWLLHRSLLHSAEVWQYGSSTSIGAPVVERLAQCVEGQLKVLKEGCQPERLVKLARCVHGDPDRIARREGQQPIETEIRLAASTGDEVAVREAFVAAIACLSGWLAIDPRTLGQVVPDHVGLHDPVQSQDILPLIRAAHWYGTSKSSLWATCSHPALDLALRDHVADAQRVLVTLRDGPLLGSLTLTSLDGDKLNPADDAGLAAYTTPHLQFRLAHDEVRELLMGERLYGDPTLAIRELYQNALDACRYRKARTEYLRRTNHAMLDWEGRIDFRQAVDEQGRPYIECEDNGIGMGRRELESCFACAGRRFADTTEFLDEQAEWLSLDPPVEFYPNSQFGIGVFSYFMLADELFIETCRLGRDGRPGETLEVRIGGSGSLFRIRPAVPAQADAGTRIRLYLSRTEARQIDPFNDDNEQDAVESISCVRTLNRLLWVAEVPTTARHHDPNDPDVADVIKWTPGELRLPRHKVFSEVDKLPTVAPHAWWLSQGAGAVLSDGLFAGERLPLAVVDLRQRHRPELSVDRTRILNCDWNFIDQSLREAAATLSLASEWLNWEWLWELYDSELRAKREVVQVLRDANVVLHYRGLSVPLRSVGICSLDKDWVDHWILDAPSSRRRTLRSRRISHEPNGSLMSCRVGLWRVALNHELPEPVWLSWRELSCVDWDRADRCLLSRDLDGGAPWLAGPVQPGHVVRAAVALEWPPRQVLARLRQLAPACGLKLPAINDADWEGLTLTDADGCLLSRNLNNRVPWLAGTVPPGHVVRAAVALEWSLPQVLSRLRELAPAWGLELTAINDADWEGLTLTGADHRLLSRNLNSRDLWLAGPVPPGHVVRAAVALEWPPRQVLARLRQLAPAWGLDLSAFRDADWEGLTLTAADFRLLSSNLNGVAPWLAGPVPPGHVVRAAIALEWSPRQVLARLRQLGPACGLELPAISDADWEGLTLTAADHCLLSCDLDSRAPWLAGPVPPGHVVGAAVALEWPPRQVLARLRQLAPAWGLELSAIRDADWEGLTLTDADLRLLSRDLNGRPPWLAGPVPSRHVVRAAVALEWPPRQVLARLRQLAPACGLELPAIDEDKVHSLELDNHHRICLSRDFNGESPWIEDLIPHRRVLEVCWLLGWTESQARERFGRFRGLGYRLFDDPDVESTLATES